MPRMLNATAATLLLAAAMSAPAAEYTFTRIVDEQSGEFLLYELGGINDSGTVVFDGRREGVEGIFVGAGGAVATAYLIGDTFVGMLDGSIGDSGAVVFKGFPTAGGEGIYLGRGGSLTTIADVSGAFVTLSPIGINRRDRVAFFATGDVSGSIEGIYTGTGGPPTTIAETGERYVDFLNFSWDINDAGAVAFLAFTEDGGEGVFAGSGGPATTIVDQDDGWSAFNGASINNAGQVIFTGYDGANAVVALGDGNALTTLVDDSGPYLGLTVPVLNDLGEYAFFSSLDTGGAGIFTGPDPVADLVIARGDHLDGYLVDEIGPPFINNRGQIAFQLRLAGGEGGVFWSIYVAEPVSEAALAAAVLPSSRSVQVGNTATAFATIVNAGPADAASCAIVPLSPAPGAFFYQTTDPATNELTGTPMTPVDIAAGASQSYLFAFMPDAPLAPEDVRLGFDCANTVPAMVLAGVNTLLLSASAGPVADIVALALTQSQDGVVRLPGSFGASAFATASVNVGVSDTVVVSADTGAAGPALDIFVCESDPVTAECLGPPQPSLTRSFAADDTPTFTIFVNGTGELVADDPANSRVYVRFEDLGGVTRGSTSVAVVTL